MHYGAVDGAFVSFREKTNNKRFWKDELNGKIIVELYKFPGTETTYVREIKMTGTGMTTLTPYNGPTLCAGCIILEKELPEKEEIE